MECNKAMKIFMFVLNILFLLNPEVVNGAPVPMTFLSNASALGAVCLDGSPPVYHFSPGSGSGVNNWLVHMEGGGWCRTIEECVQRQKTYRGSSAFMPNVSFSGILGHKQSSNPDFYNWNRIKVRYCDGSSFTGDVESVDPTTKLYLRGNRIWVAIIKELMEKGMKNAKIAMLSGCSAGGLASILHCDKFRDMLPADATVKCLSDAGYFLHTKDIAGRDSIYNYYSAVVATHGSANNLPSSCTSKFSDPNLCFFPQYVVQNLRTPLFALNSAYDSWQIKNILVPTSAKATSWKDCRLDISKCNATQISTLQSYRSQFISALPNTTTSGKFIISCYAHCLSGTQATWLTSTSPKIANVTIAKAVGDWFNGRRVVQDIDCPYPCNKSCPTTVDE